MNDIRHLEIASTFFDKDQALKLLPYLECLYTFV